MKGSTLLNALAAAVLIAAAILNHSLGNRSGVLTLAFGLFNAIVTPPGTSWVRWIAIGATLVAFVNPWAFVLLAFLMWLVWPVAYTVAWALGSRAAARQQGGEPSASASLRARVGLSALVVAVAAASVAYRLMGAHEHLQQTSALFIGIPALLAIVVILMVSPTSARGVACKAVTVGLLVSMIFLGEGMVCIAMSAPLFFAVALAIATAAEQLADRRAERGKSTVACIVLLAIGPMTVEGVSELTTVNRHESVIESRTVEASADAVAQALFEPPRFDRPLPIYLRAGFPSPAATRITGDAKNVRWVIRMRGGEMRLNGMEARAGDLVLLLEESRAGLLRWRAVADDSHMTHFLDWRGATVCWEPIDAHSTRVTWTLTYDRRLDPAWYFGPMERYAMHLAARYLIDAVATP